MRTPCGGAARGPEPVAHQELAQVNVARLVAPLDDPAVAEPDDPLARRGRVRVVRHHDDRRPLPLVDRLQERQELAQHVPDR